MSKKQLSFDIEVFQEASPFCARVIMRHAWRRSIDDARQCLLTVTRKWPAGIRTDFLITCGGFITFEWPDGIDSSKAANFLLKDRKLLQDQAESAVQQLLTPRLLQVLRSRTKYLTIGVDSSRTPRYFDADLHVELVAIINLERPEEIKFTGKSYPTPSQARNLVTWPMTSHFITLNRKRACILGCHDLNLFSHRSHALALRHGKTGEKWKQHREFAKLMKSERPSVVLQHPHTSDTEKIWNTAISGMVSDYEDVKMFASAGRYYEYGGCRSNLETVRQKTRIGSSLDFVVRPIR